MKSNRRRSDVAHQGGTKDHARGKVDPDKLPGRVLVVRIDADGNRKATQ
jgi:hypothetical protein